MVQIAYLNPLSDTGKEIVRRKSDLQSVFYEDIDLLDIVSSTNNQNLDDDSKLPKKISDLVLKRINWYIEKSNNKNYDSHDYSYLFNDDITDYDVIAFHLSSQAIAYKFNYNSREMRLFIQSEGAIIEERLSRLLLNERRMIVNDVLSELMVSGTVEWTFLKDILSSRKLSLTDLVIDDGEVVLRMSLSPVLMNI